MVPKIEIGIDRVDESMTTCPIRHGPLSRVTSMDPTRNTETQTPYPHLQHE